MKKSSKKKSSGSGGGGSSSSSKKTLTINTLGSGAVTSAPAGISCGSVCSAKYSSSQTVTLTATAGAGFVFTGWSGPCAGTGTCSVKLSSNRVVGATFRPVINGVCGAADGARFTSAPERDLCTTGTASQVELRGDRFGWSCAGSRGGATAECQADKAVIPATALLLAGPTTLTTGVVSSNFTVSGNGVFTRDITVTPVVNGGGTFSPTTIILSEANRTGTFRYTAGSAGSKTITLTNDGSLTNPAGWALTVVDSPVDGTCGTADGQSVFAPPSANLCVAGTASSVTTNASTYSWTCTGTNGGLTAGCSATRLIAPTATISASPTTITSGQSSTITWSSTNATSCTGSNGWSGTKASSGTQAVSPTSTTTYALTCSGPGGTTGTQSVTVTVTAAPINGACGASQGGSSTTPPSTNLCTAGSASSVTTNTSTYTWSCAGTNGGTTASCSSTRLTPTNGTCGSANGQSFSSAPSTNLCSTGTASSVATNASTYTWSCAGQNGGTASSCSATRLIAPTATISASPTTITSGQSSTITWSSTNATSCTISNGSQSADAGTSGNSATPALTTTTIFTLTCTGASGTATNSVTVTVSGTPTPTNGSCGTSHGQTFSSAPSTNLCTTGTASSVITNTSTYTWNCAGSNGGTTASCSATRTQPAATALTLSGPTSGTVNQASTSFTVSANGSLSSSITITPSSNGGGGTFSPTTLTLNATTTTATFTYTPTSTGQKTVSITNNGSLANPGGIAYGVTAGGGASYALPSPGQAVAIGTNSAMDVVPTNQGWTQAAWEYSLFNSYGGGQFVPAYSDRGAYVLVGTGGHNHPDNNGAAVFDFANATWSRLDNANGVSRPTSSPWSFSTSQSNGSPYYENTGTETPLPPHPYANLVYLPTGSKGSVAYVTRAGIGIEAATSGASHRFDLSTRMWSRLTAALSTRIDFDSDSVYDSARNRVWILPNALHNFQNVQYLDLDDNSLKTTAPNFSWPSSSLGTGYNRAFMHDSYILRYGGGGSSLWLFDPDQPSAGWIQLTVSGTLPNSMNRWARYSDGKYYAFSGSSAANTITRIVPPANAKTGTWTVDTVTLSGATLPARTGSTEHYTRFFYVPAIDSLAWIAGGTNQVIILKPPGAPTPVNGSCGTSHGQTFSSAPSTNLCTTGTASSVITNTSTYTWNCAGSNGGTTASCSATRATASLPAWVPAAGEVAVLTQSNGKIANQFESQVAPYYDPFHYVKTVNDYSGAFKNPYWGTYGATVFWGGGHAGTNDNTVTVAEYGQNAITFKRVSDPTPWTGSTATDAGNRGSNSVGDFNGTTLNLTYMEGADGQPGAPHSYSSGDIIGPEHGGATFGTLVQIAASAVNYRNDAGAVAAHKIDFDTMSLQKANGQNRKWTRITDNRGLGGFMGASPHYTAFVPAQNRIYYAASSGSATRWFDRNTNTYVTGTGTGFDFGPSDGFDSGIMFHVPSRNLLVAMYPQGGQLKVQWMDVSVNQPSIGGTATLSQNLAIADPWSAATWVPDTNRIVLAGVSGDNGAAYEIEIPASPSSTWTVTRAPFGSGQTFSPYDPTAGIGLTYKKFEYDAKVKSIVYMPRANRDGADETIWVYRPRGT